MKNNWSLVIWIPAFMGISLALGLYLGGDLKKEASSSTLTEILDYIDAEYVDEVEKRELVGRVMQNVLQELDPHSYYISPEEVALMNEPIEGGFDGIGVQFLVVNDTIVVVTPVAGGPSEKAGILAGDRILKADTMLLAGVGISNQQVRKNLKGPSGSTVKLTIYRPSTLKELEFDVERGRIPLVSVDASFMLDGETGYVLLSKFSKTTGKEFHEKATELLEKGMTKLVLDLRGNGGGVLQEAVKVVDEFLEDGKMIVYTDGRAKNRKEHFSSNDGVLKDTEVAILIDEGSASASEIVAGALQDNDRATIIGRRSFGKGLVQEQTNWPDGSAIRLTIARYYTPTGRSIQRPYTDGADEYRDEVRDRLMEGDSFDISDIADSLKFTTPGGKVVYGGGGIYPDLYVKPNYHSNDELVYWEYALRGIFNQYGFKYVDEHRDELASYNSADDFMNEFDATGQPFDDLVAFAESKGIVYPDSLMNPSKAEIIRRWKAQIGRNLIGNDAFYPIVLGEDKMIKIAKSALEDEEQLVVK